MSASPQRRSLILVLSCCVVAVLSLVLTISSANASMSAHPTPARPGVQKSGPASVATSFQGSAYFDLHTRMVSNAEIASGATLSVAVDGQFGLPAANVSMIAFDASVEGETANGTLAVEGATATPAVSYRSGSYVHNMVLARRDGPQAGKQLTLTNTGTGKVRVYLALQGYFLSGGGNTGGSAFTAVPPSRIVSGTSVAANGTFVMSPQGKGGIPTSGVTYVAFTLTAKSAQTGKLFAYPAGTARPGDASLDYGGGIYYQNFVIAKVGASGGVDIDNVGTAAVPVYVDVAGYFTAASDSSAALGETMTPTRVVSSVSVPAKGTRTFSPLGVGGIPGYDVAAVALNVTATSTATGSIIIYSSDDEAPATNVLVMPAKIPYSALTIAEPGADGNLVILNTSTAAATVSVDATGYFQVPPPPTSPDAPANVRATAADSQAAVTWSAPDDGGSPVTGYTVIVHPGGATVTAAAGATTVAVTGLTDGQPYFFTVVASNAVGDSDESTPSPDVTPRGPETPNAAFTANCVQATRTCTVDASASGTPTGTIVGYTWSFGDGGTASGPTATYTYGDGGTYEIELVVTNDQDLTAIAEQQVALEQSPIPAFTTSCAGLRCTFDASSSSGTDGTITGYAWKFGNGASATGQVVTTTYTAGRYEVTLTVTDSNSLAASTSRSITVAAGNVPPVPVLVPTCDATSLWCGFDATASDDVDGTVVSFRWTYGDGGTGDGPTASHTYQTTGPYTMTLTITDNTGATATMTKSITPGTSGPDPTLFARFSYFCGPEECDYDGTGSWDTAGNVAGYSWDFGDGTTGTDATPSHNYSAVGAYTVHLTVTDDAGATATTSKQVNVTELGAPPGTS